MTAITSYRLRGGRTTLIICGTVVGAAAITFYVVRWESSHLLYLLFVFGLSDLICSTRFSITEQNVLCGHSNISVVYTTGG